MTAGAFPATTPRVRAGTYAGLFAVTLSTLAYEIVLTRIFSVTMWYHFAFVAISVALFGMTVGALVVHLLPHRFADADVERRLATSSLLFAVSIAVCFVVQLTIPFSPRWSAGGVASVVATCVVISIPFVFSGIVVCLALTRFPQRVNRLYAVDLVGAAAGCVVMVVLFVWLDGPSVVLAVAAVAACGALAFAVEAGRGRGRNAALIALVVLAGFASANGVLYSQGRAPLRVRWVKETRDGRHLYERWNAFSRVTVDDPAAQSATAPARPGTSAAPSGVQQLWMVIDSTAATVLTRYSGRPEQTASLRGEITNLPHYVRHGDVLVVGVGGGRDVLSALEFKQRSVTGVEINPDILRALNHTYGAFSGHLDRNPKVKLVNDEARSYLARTHRKFDILQISLIDTWAATSAGAYALSENSLYTTQAWKLFFDRLKPGGVLSVSRWYQLGDGQPLETFRTVSLAAQALEERGVHNPRDHILVYHGLKNAFNVNAATVLVSLQPFSRADVARLTRASGRQPFTPVLTPDVAADPRFAALTAPGTRASAVRRFTADISAPTDDRPFFFQMADLRTLLSGKGFENNYVTRPVLVLAVLALTVLLLAAACIVVPLLVTTDRAAHRGMGPYYTYFGGIGLGFLLVEVAQLQRLSVFLGNPTYALTVVLFSVLLASGIGSMLSERIGRAGGRRSLLAPLAALLVVLLGFGWATPVVIRHLAGATTPVRMATAVALVMPLGLLMGMPFALGMRAAAARPGAPTAFLWGINGATSVCGSVFGVVIALFYGISKSYWAGFGAYALALVSMVAISRATRREVHGHVAAVPAERVAAPV